MFTTRISPKMSAKPLATMKSADAKLIESSTIFRKLDGSWTAEPKFVVRQFRLSVVARDLRDEEDVGDREDDAAEGDQDRQPPPAQERADPVTRRNSGGQRAQPTTTLTGGVSAFQTVAVIERRASPRRPSARPPSSSTSAQGLRRERAHVRPVDLEQVAGRVTEVELHPAGRVRRGAASRRLSSRGSPSPSPSRRRASKSSTSNETCWRGVGESSSLSNRWSC